MKEWGIGGHTVFPWDIFLRVPEKQSSYLKDNTKHKPFLPPMVLFDHTFSFELLDWAYSTICWRPNYWWCVPWNWTLLSWSQMRIWGEAGDRQMEMEKNTVQRYPQYQVWVWEPSCEEMSLWLLFSQYAAFWCCEGHHDQRRECILGWDCCVLMYVLLCSCESSRWEFSFYVVSGGEEEMIKWRDGAKHYLHFWQSLLLWHCVCEGA